MNRPAALEAFLQRLAPTLGNRLRTDAEALERVRGDESGMPGCLPACVFQPQSTEEVSRILQEAHDLGVGIVPRGAGTGKAGACIPRSQDVVLDLSPMHRLLALHQEDGYAIVEPGLITGQFDALMSEHGLMYPPDPASFESCSLGGNISTNAGGPRAVKYGVTQRYVWGLELVLPGGRVLRTGKRSIKGVGGLNLTALLVGSEGTLAVVTQAWLHVIARPRDVQTAWLSFPDLAAASRAGAQVFAAGVVPRMLEVLDRTAMGLVRPVSPFRVPEAGAALLLETDGDEGRALPELVRACEVAMAHGASDAVIAQNEKEREGMRRARRLVSSRMKETYPLKISDDIAVPRSRMVEMLERARALAEQQGVPFSAYGHLGDGNVHINFLCTAAQKPSAEYARSQAFRLAIDLGGCISGEHGIGLAKRAELPWQQGEAVQQLQRDIKGVFDPRGIMNPGKVF